MLGRGGYYCWKLDPNRVGTDAVQQNGLTGVSNYPFPLYALIQKVLKKVKVEEEKVPSLIIVTTTWQTQSWYPETLHSWRLSVIPKLS